LAAGALLAMQMAGQPAGAAPPPRADWHSFGGDSSEQHYSPLDQISTANVQGLGLAWSYDVDTFDSYTQPIEVGGVVYFAAGLSVITALDARTGKLLWRYDPDVAGQPEAKTKMRAGWGTRGIAYKDGLVFTATREGAAGGGGCPHRQAALAGEDAGRGRGRLYHRAAMGGGRCGDQRLWRRGLQPHARLCDGL
jgi:quinohemoprotein ethanol dehydrogenase